MASNLSQENAHVEMSELNKEKVETYDIEGAINELNQITDESAEMFYKLKQIKFDYLVKMCDLYSRIDLPSIMMDACRKEINSTVPKAKNIDMGKY